MIDFLSTVIAEQNSPEEVVVFLLLTVVLILLLAFSLYAVVLLLLWRKRLRGVSSLRSLFFPSRAQLRKYLGEYALAASTAVLLTLTVAAKHDAVETVLAYDLGELRTEDVLAAMPALRVDDISAQDGGDIIRLREELLEAQDTDSLALGGALLRLPVSAVLVALVEAGQASRASEWLTLALRNAGANPWTRFPTARHLLFLAVVLLIGYVLWFAWQRSSTVAKAGGPTSTEYGKVVGRLLTPAVCIALLLVSAVSAADVARSAERAAAVTEQRVLRGSIEPQARWLTDAYVTQERRRKEVDRFLSFGDSLSAFTRMLGGIQRGMQALTDSTRGLRGDLGQIESSLINMGSLKADAASLDSLAGLLASHSADLLPTLAVLEADLDGRRQAAVDALLRDIEALTGTIDDRFDALDQRMEALIGRLRAVAQNQEPFGLILVRVQGGETTNYTLQNADAPNVAERGDALGLHVVPPGRYRVQAGQLSTVRVADGEAVTVLLSGAIG